MTDSDKPTTSPWRKGDTEYLNEAHLASRPPALRVQPEFRPGVVVDGRYALEEEIGRGGMGQVFRGKHLTLDVPIAIKVMLPQVATNLEYTRRFRREARSMSVLKHRNIAQVLDYGDVDGTPYMVMEFLEGLPLSHYLAQSPGLPALSEVKRILFELVDAMEAAHRNGIVHRDLKPENIFLAIEADGKQVVKVLDFGLARVLDPNVSEGAVTEVGLVAGTPEYMSPEQCRSMDVGPSADIYALGCVLTELLQKSPPFSAGSSAELMTKHMFLDPPPLDRSPTDELVPLSLEKLRLDLLAKLPASRPSTMARVRTRLTDTFPDEEDRNSRKPPEMPGTRDSRSAAAFATSATVTVPSVSARPSQPPRRGLISVYVLGDHEPAVSQDVILGLKMHGYEAVRCASGTPVEERADVVVLDAGHQLTEAVDWLASQEHRPKVRPVACGSNVSEALPALIAAGIGDVLSVPLDSSVLARKVTRLLAERDQENLASTVPPPI